VELSQLLFKNKQNKSEAALINISPLKTAHNITQNRLLKRSIVSVHLRIRIQQIHTDPYPVDWYLFKNGFLGNSFESGIFGLHSD
jgi:hypothetical protein